MSPAEVTTRVALSWAGNRTAMSLAGALPSWGFAQATLKPSASALQTQTVTWCAMALCRGHTAQWGVLRSGTSIGANIRESVNAQSRMDFINKLNIALKEANETEYWLELLYESDFLNEEEYMSIYNDCGKIAATLTKIIRTTKSVQP